MIRPNLEALLKKVDLAAKRAGKSGKDIRLLAVSKTFSPEHIEEAAALGLTEFGESRVQEATGKIEFLKTRQPGLKWHMIGHLQRNKAAKAVELFDTIQSVDSLRLAEALDRKAAEIGKVQSVLVEIKVSEEPSKSGLPPEELEAFLESCKSYRNLQVNGMMCIAPLLENVQASRPYFARARQIFERQFPAHAILSMGMSQDFEIAIEEGSNLIRVGSALFGERPAL